MQTQTVFYKGYIDGVVSKLFEKPWPHVKNGQMNIYIYILI